MRRPPGHILAAMIRAPLAVFAILAVIGLLSVLLSGDSLLAAEFVYIIPIVSLFNAGATWTIGLAWHAIVSRLVKGPALDLYLLPGALFGWLLMRLLHVLPPHGPLDNPILSSGLGALIGAATASIFWLIRRPDRDAPNPPTPSP
jgi:hypothetical protein